jgi:O-antigen/teichoic acid export membrane protein
MDETKNSNNISLTSGRVLARNTVVNLIGQVVPLFIALFTIPLIVKGLGTDRFGVLMLAWMVVGYFSLFDMGIGRATTKFVADYIARGESGALPQLVWTSLVMLLCFGLAGGLLLAALNPFLVSNVLKIPSLLRDETVRSFYVLAAAIPLVLGTAGTRGVLEAQQRFSLVNAIKIPVSIASYAAPLLVLPFSNSLYHITAVLLLSRLVEFMAYLHYCFQFIPGMNRPQWPKLVYLKKLLGFGGWLTVSNIVGPLMTYMDRFIIGGMLSMSAVAYYATPYDFVARLAVIPGSLLSVMFPALSASFLVDPNRFVMLYDKTVKYILLALTPVVLILTVLAKSFLSVWLGQEFAGQSTLVLQILSIGFLANSLAQVPYSAVQAMGRPDITAKIHLIELPLYLGMIWFLVLKMGIAGAALAWLIRIVFDTVVLYLFAHRMMPGEEVRRGILIKSIMVIIITLLLSVYISSIMTGFMPRFFFLTCYLSAVIIFFWHILLNIEEKKMIIGLRNKLMGRSAHQWF